MKILLADDKLSTDKYVIALEEMLKKKNFDCITAKSKSEAELKLKKDKDIKLVILDIFFPSRSTGKELADRVISDYNKYLILISAPEKNIEISHEYEEKAKKQNKGYLFIAFFPKNDKLSGRVSKVLEKLELSPLKFRRFCPYKIDFHPYEPKMSDTIPIVFVGYPGELNGTWKSIKDNIEMNRKDLISKYQIEYCDPEFQKQHYNNWWHEYIFVTLLAASIAIFDLRESNLNVFFEVGISYGLGRKTVLLAKDINQYDIPPSLTLYKFRGNWHKFAAVLAKDFGDLESFISKIKQSDDGVLEKISGFEIFIQPITRKARDKVHLISSEPERNYIEQHLPSKFKLTYFDVDNLDKTKISQQIKVILDNDYIIIKVPANINITKEFLLMVMAGIATAQQKSVQIIVENNVDNKELADLGELVKHKDKLDEVIETLERNFDALNV